ncbi:MAG: hypothetical protein KKH29_05775 [Candidatus Omnitrophica bacterium]|nr:hypothetical protein [Candidatus Omnitrophota bacterium]MBU4472892.1 hypothetical protein [Candidatus Omnitrophota bacterium]MCG2706126.1 hypothetical protein [Candidatus Omnitrophota bacterium]
MKFIADFHIHSKYSRATSRDMDIAHIAEWAGLKGVTLMGTGDFTHHLWLEEVKAHLEDLGNGLFKYRNVYFILTAEISSIYSKNGRGYRIHNMVFSPSFKTTDKINETLARYGNLASDGRPILGMDAEELARIIFDIDENCMVVPAHCLLPGTFVHTNNGLKIIEEISKKDYVYTHRMRLRSVTELFKRDYNGEIFHIKPYYFREGIKTTAEHPFYIIKTHKYCASRGTFCMPRCSQLKNKGCKQKYFMQYKPEWVQAKDIKINDALVFPRFNNEIRYNTRIEISRLLKGKFVFKEGKIAYKGSRTRFVKNIIEIDKDFCRLAGYFISEGYTNSRDCISFCFLEDEEEYINDVISLIQKIFGIELSKIQIKKDIKGIELIFYSKVLYNLFSKLFYINTRNKKAFSKSLPNWMLYLPLEKQVETIKGWWRGDKGYTSSRPLMNQMKVLFLRLGIIPSIGLDSTKKHKNRGKHFIGTREILAQHDMFHFNNLSFFEDKFNLLKDSVFKKFRTKLSTRHGWMDNKYVYLPVRDISKERYNGVVYNLEVDEDNSYVCEFATVHNCWTPWFSLFGSMSGFDRIEDCFEKQTPKIFALETGLSSDPPLNWRLSALDKFTLISNSDSHSPSKIGREANVFDCALDYKTIREVLKTKDKKRFLYTVEFFPEEGKYHYDGHRLCGMRLSPGETKQNKGRCPKCGKPVTVGVMNRVEQLADRPEGYMPADFIPYKNLIPLDEIIAGAKGVGKGSMAVERDYRSMIAKFGTEFEILLKATKEDLLKGMPPRVAEGILRVRQGKVNIQAGFDGEYGKIAIFDPQERHGKDEEQLSLF